MNCLPTTGNVVGLRQSLKALALLFVATSFVEAQERPEQPKVSENPQPVIKPDKLDPPATFVGKLECIDGNSINLLDPNDIGTVVIFISTDCPIGNSYQPLLEQFRSQWSQQKLQLIMIHGNPQVTKQQALLHAKDYNIRWPITLDPQQKIAKLLQARNIPEAFLLDWKGNIVYRGRIDDQYSALGKKRPEPTTNDLNDAVDCLLNGKPIKNRETKAVGCVIRYANP